MPSNLCINENNSLVEHECDVGKLNNNILIRVFFELETFPEHFLNDSVSRLLETLEDLWCSITSKITHTGPASHDSAA